MIGPDRGAAIIPWATALAWLLLIAAIVEVRLAAEPAIWAATTIGAVSLAFIAAAMAVPRWRRIGLGRTAQALAPLLVIGCLAVVALAR